MKNAYRVFVNDKILNVVSLLAVVTRRRRRVCHDIVLLLTKT